MSSEEISVAPPEQENEGSKSLLESESSMEQPVASDTATSHQPVEEPQVVACLTTSKCVVPWLNHTPFCTCV